MHEQSRISTTLTWSLALVGRKRREELSPTIQWIASAGMDIDPDENPVVEVFAYSGTRARTENVMEAEDTTVATLRYMDGPLGQLLAETSMFPGSGMVFQVAGRDGTVAARGDDLVSWQFREEMPEEDEVRAQFGPGGPPVDASDPLETANLRAFLEARNSGTSFALDHEEARKAVEIVEVIYESANANESVLLT